MTQPNPLPWHATPAGPYTSPAYRAVVAHLMDATMSPQPFMEGLVRDLIDRFGIAPVSAERPCVCGCPKLHHVPDGPLANNVGPCATCITTACPRYRPATLDVLYAWQREEMTAVRALLEPQQGETLTQAARRILEESREVEEEASLKMDAFAQRDAARAEVKRLTKACDQARAELARVQSRLADVRATCCQAHLDLTRARVPEGELNDRIRTAIETAITDVLGPDDPEPPTGRNVVDKDPGEMTSAGWKPPAALGDESSVTRLVNAASGRVKSYVVPIGIPVTTTDGRVLGAFVGLSKDGREAVVREPETDADLRERVQRAASIATGADLDKLAAAAGVPPRK